MLHKSLVTTFVVLALNLAGCIMGGSFHDRPDDFTYFGVPEALGDASAPYVVETVIADPEALFTSTGSEVTVTVHAVLGDYSNLWFGFLVLDGADVIGGEPERAGVDVAKGDSASSSAVVRAMSNEFTLNSWAVNEPINPPENEVYIREISASSLLVSHASGTVAIEKQALRHDTSLSLEFDNENTLRYSVVVESPQDQFVSLQYLTPVRLMVHPAKDGTLVNAPQDALEFEFSDERPAAGDGTYPVKTFIYTHPGIDASSSKSIRFCIVYSGSSVTFDTTSRNCSDQ